MAGHPDSIDVKTADGAVLRAFREGRGPALMLISGLGGTAGFWSPVAQRLMSQFTIIRFDQRGIAGSTRGAGPCSIAALAQDSLHVLDAMGVSQAIVLGHSTGGCIAQSMASMASSRLERVILSATWMSAGPYMRALFSMRKSLLDHVPQAYAESAALLSYPADWLQEHWDIFEKAVAGAPRSQSEKAIITERIDALLAHDGRAMLQALTMPTLVIGAEDDLIVPPFHQRELAAHLSKSQLMMMPKGGHFFPITQTDRFIATLSDFAGAA